MPRSKRNKIVSLTKTSAKGKDLKKTLIQTLRGALDEYKDVYVMSFHNMRPSLFKDVRMDWRESRIFMGKNKVAQIALGRSPEEEYRDNLCNVSKLLEGDVGLLFTNRNKKEVLSYFKGFCRSDYCKAGTIPNEDIIIPPGILSQFPTTMLDQLRKLGMVVEIDNGAIHLREQYVAAQKGIPMTPEQAKSLVHMDKKLIEFRIRLLCHWHDGIFEDRV